MSRATRPGAETNLELAKAFWEAGDRGDVEALPSFYAPDVELDFRPMGAVGVGVYRGHSGLREWLADWAHQFEAYESNLEELIEAPPDHVIARVRGQGRARGGVPIDMRVWQVAEFRAGKIVRVETFLSEEQALEAVGLRE